MQLHNSKMDDSCKRIRERQKFRNVVTALGESGGKLFFINCSLRQYRTEVEVPRQDGANDILTELTPSATLCS
jgi:hypothetical protein